MISYVCVSSVFVIISVVLSCSQYDNIGKKIYEQKITNEMFGLSGRPANDFVFFLVVSLNDLINKLSGQR